MARAGLFKDRREQPFASHPQQYARRSSDAGKHTGDHADKRAEVNGRAERRDACPGGKQVQRARGVAEFAGFAAETKDLRVRAQYEEDAGEDGALNHSARNGAQWIARFAAEGGGAFETHKAEHGQHECGPKVSEGNSAQAELVHIEMKAEANGHNREDDADEADRADFDPEHQFGGELDIAICDEARGKRRQRQE